MDIGKLFMIFFLLVPNGILYAQESVMTREMFASTLAKVKQGDSTQAVVNLLGMPSKVLKAKDMEQTQLPMVMRSTGASEVWYYGTNHTLDFPTLGELHFDNTSKIIATSGGKGTPCSLSDISECELRELLRLVNSTPLASCSNWDPAGMVSVVNALVDHGKEDGLAVIREYIRVSPFNPDAYEQVGLLLRVLHEVPDDTRYFPELLLGISSFKEPEDPTLIPRYPIHLLRHEIPVFLPASFTHSGSPPDPTGIVDWYELNGVWRKSKITIPEELSAEELVVLQQEVMDLLTKCVGPDRAASNAEPIFRQLKRIVEQKK